jgi:hypothetical protein
MPYRHCYWIILMMISCSFYMSMFQPASHYKSLLMTSDTPLHPKLKLVTKTSTITATPDQFSDTILLGLPFTVIPICPVFQPIAGYPKCLCLFGNVQLDLQFSPLTSTVWLHFLMALPMLHIIQTGSYAAYLTIAQLWPSRKPPY